jgi:hypothetical protein
MPHTVEKISTTLLQNSSQSEVYTQNYGPPKLRESQLWEVWDSHLGVPGRNVIWVLVPWPSTEYTIRGKVVAPPKSRSWWILWVHVCPWLIRAPKALKLCTNQLVIWFVQVHVHNWCLSFFLIPISGLQHAPLPPKCCEPGTMPQLFTLPLFSPQTHIWVYQGV